MSTPGLPPTTDPYATDPFARGPRTSTGSTAARTTSGSGPGSGTAETAEGEAAGVASAAADSGKHVAGVAKDQAADVVGQAKDQAKDLLGQTRNQLSQQTTAGQARAASGLGSLASELRDLADGKGGSGVATDLAHQASQRLEAAASWLGDREPADVLRDVQAFARRRPVAFLAIAAGAGLVAGRLTRGLGAVAHDAHDASEATDTRTDTRDAFDARDDAATRRVASPVADADQALVTGTADPVYGTAPSTSLPGDDRGWNRTGR